MEFRKYFSWFFKALTNLIADEWSEWRRTAANQSKEILLWIFILIVSWAILLPLEMVKFGLFATAAILFRNKFNITPKGYFTFFGVITVAINLLFQSKAIESQNAAVQVQIDLLQVQNTSLDLQNKALMKDAEEAQLDRRPYLFVDFEYGLSMRENDLLFGANMTFVNRGRYPARILGIDYEVCDEKTCPDFRTWHRDTYGGYPELSVVPPGRLERVMYLPGIRREALVGYIGVIVRYEGYESDRVYWYKRLEKFKIVRDDKGTPDLVLIERDIDWDGNTGNPIALPKWSTESQFGYNLQSFLSQHK